MKKRKIEMKKKSIFDIHLHTSRYSFCSNLLPEDLIKYAKRRNLDGVVITEHGKVWSQSDLYRLQESAEKDNLKIFSGQEIRVLGSDGREGDVLVYGINKDFEEYLPIDELLKIVDSEGGVAVAAHPRRNILGLHDDIYLYQFHGIEILNSNYNSDEIFISLNDMKYLNCAFTGGSDAHSIDRIGRYVTIFYEPINSIEDIVKAIRKKKCFPAAGFITEEKIGEILGKKNLEILNIKQSIP